LLYWLLFTKLQHYFPPFRIFRYVTFRTAFASLTALFTALIVGPLVINRLARIPDRTIHSRRRSQGSSEKSRHADHGRLADRDCDCGADAAVGRPGQSFCVDRGVRHVRFAAIGFADDYTKVAHRRNLGLTARQKLGLQFATSVLIAVMLIAMQTYGMYSTSCSCRSSNSFIPTW
jgi:phospho-N-acetylmuramoyl-pentapeptide-transferase